MSATLTFPAVTPAQFAALKAEATKNGIVIAGNSGTATAHFCTVAFAYPEVGLAPAPLTFTLLHAPPFCGGIALGKLHDLVEQILAEQPPAGPAESVSDVKS